MKVQKFFPYISLVLSLHALRNLCGCGMFFIEVKNIFAEPNRARVFYEVYCACAMTKQNVCEPDA